MRLLLSSLVIGLALLVAAPIHAQTAPSTVDEPDCKRTRTGATKVIVQIRGSVTSEQKAIICVGESYLEKAVNNPKFKNSILGEGQQQPIQFKERRFLHANGRSESMERNKIWEIIREGKERPGSTASSDDPKVINIQVVLAPKRRPTVGSTILGKQPVRTAYWFVDAAAQRKDGVSVARHLLHEWLHIAGFYHYPDNSARGDVPYALGNLVRELLRNRADRESATGNLKFGSLALDKMREQADNEGEDPLLAYLLDEAEDDLDIGDVDFTKPELLEEN